MISPLANEYSMEVMTRTCQVLIVGAGPVGLLLALLLKQRGVEVILVERQKALYPLPRAVLFDHESRRLFSAAGLSEQIEGILENVIGKGGEDGINFVWRDADLKLVVDLFTEDRTRSDFPSIMGFSQPQLELVLETAVLERGIPLLRGYALRSLEQNAEDAEAKFTRSSAKETTYIEKGVYKGGSTSNGSCQADREATSNGNSSEADWLSVRASYVIGCDGANSTVRHLQDFSITTLNFENDWLITDLRILNNYLPPLVAKLGTAQICDPRRPTTTVFAGAGRKRFEFMRLSGESREDLLHEDTAWELLGRWGFDKSNCVLERKVIYTFKARWSNEFFKDKVILAGDALHQMPPFIGQGLNSGFRDAAALAWRLPLIVNGVAQPETLLQSYQTERLHHVRYLTEQCMLLGEVVCETDPVKSRNLHDELRRHPPPKTYDPPLGKPGVLTSQPEAGKLSLQRRLKRNTDLQLFDDVHGFGWTLLNLGTTTAETHLSSEQRHFFVEVLKGKCCSVTENEDWEGEYRGWFDKEMALGDVALIRPDFYVFGHAPIREVDRLVEALSSSIGYRWKS